MLKQIVGPSGPPDPKASTIAMITQSTIAILVLLWISGRTALGVNTLTVASIVIVLVAGMSIYQAARTSARRPPSPQTSVSSEERLRRLDELAARGAISEQERITQRQRILADL